MWFARLLLVLAGPLAAAYDLDPDSSSSVISIAKQMTEDMMAFYNGDKPGGVPGLLPSPYYWWEAGAMMGSLIDYWLYTGDNQYNKLVEQALLFQVGDHDDYMPRNQTLTEGNDDQGFWGLAVMTAAESRFPDPPSDKPQWLALAQAVFNTQAARWDTQNCNGGLRWQIFKWNQGYDYKNSISQACFFALGARLALYTGNSSYAEWADRTWDWMTGVGFIDQYWRVIDGAHIGHNCTDHVPYQFSYNAGGFILGAAAMYNHTESPVWKERLDNLIKGSEVFFTGPQKNIMTEVACESVDRCDLNQQSFKAYVSRWFAVITKWAPHTYDVVMPLLRASAVAAAKQCSGGDNKRMCGLKWYQDKYDGSSGVGQQMAAMEVTLACMVKDTPAPVRHDNGGTSLGSPGSGGLDIGRDEPAPPNYKPISAGDRGGAAILTVLVLGSLVAGIGWVLLDETSDEGALQQLKGLKNFAFAAAAAIAAAVVALVAAAKAGRKTHGFRGKSGLRAANEDESSSSLAVLEKNQALEGATVRIGRVRSESMGTQRRLSNMPIGWPRQNNYTRSGLTEELMIEPRTSGSGFEGHGR